MIWNFIVQILISVALSLIAYAISPKPKPQRPKEIDPALLEEPTAEVGRPVPVVFGSVTVQSPNVLDTTDKSQVRHKNRKENPNTSTYHLSAHYAICHGPVDFLRRVRIREKVASGVVMGMDGTTLDLNYPEFAEGLDREGGIQGRIHFQNGSNTQLLTEVMADKYSDIPANLPGYRGLATAMFTENPDDPFVLDGETIPGFYWSANSPFIPPADFMVTRIPSQWYSLTATIATPITEALRDEDAEEAIQYTIGPDANPIHIIREALTNATWGGGVPTTLLDDTAWRAAALTLFNENFGISIIWLQQVTIEKFIENILNHIDANVFVNRRTGCSP